MIVKRTVVLLGYVFTVPIKMCLEFSYIRDYQKDFYIKDYGVWMINKIVSSKSIGILNSNGYVRKNWLKLTYQIIKKNKRACHLKK